MPEIRAQQDWNLLFLHALCGTYHWHTGHHHGVVWWRGFVAGSDQRVAEQPLGGKSVSHFQKMSRETAHTQSRVWIVQIRAKTSCKEVKKVFRSQSQRSSQGSNFRVYGTVFYFPHLYELLKKRYESLDFTLLGFPSPLWLSSWLLSVAGTLKPEVPPTLLQHPSSWTRAQKSLYCEGDRAYFSPKEKCLKLRFLVSKTWLGSFCAQRTQSCFQTNRWLERSSQVPDRIDQGQITWVNL